MGTMERYVKVGMQELDQRLSKIVEAARKQPVSVALRQVQLQVPRGRARLQAPRPTAAPRSAISTRDRTHPLLDSPRRRAPPTRIQQVVVSPHLHRRDRPGRLPQ